jgi:hypothetical protein
MDEIVRVLKEKQWQPRRLHPTKIPSKKEEIKIFSDSWAWVAHTFNSSYSGGRDQEECSSKPAQENCLRDLVSKILNTKKG